MHALFALPTFYVCFTYVVEDRERQEQEHADAIEGMTQMRGVEAEGADKYRITLEVQQDLFGWFDIEAEPIAKHGMPLLILIGVHARLSNLDDDGCFIKDEAFEWQGTPVFRKAKTSARGLLRSWVKLRNTNPKARAMLEYIDVMQQPNGFQDSIISLWRIEREASLGKYPQCLHSRDLNASYLSESARQGMFLSHEVGHFIAGKVGAVIQPTDTGVVFPLKAQAGRTQNEMRRQRPKSWELLVTNSVETQKLFN